jgi:hypothetical protein
MTPGADFIIVSVMLSKAKHLNTEILHGVYTELSRRVQNDIQGCRSEHLFVILSESEGSQILRLRLSMRPGADLIIVSVILSGSEGSKYRDSSRSLS